MEAGVPLPQASQNGVPVAAGEDALSVGGPKDAVDLLGDALGPDRRAAGHVPQDQLPVVLEADGREALEDVLSKAALPTPYL